MKNKKYVPYLIAVTAVVWGLIIYRVIAGMGNSSDDVVPQRTPIVHQAAMEDYTPDKDTGKLNLKYPDPFGQQKDTVTTKHVSILPVSKNKITVSPVNWSFITYAGYIRNPQTKKLLTIIKINNQTLNMAEGETVDKVKLLKNLQDSVKITFNGKTTFLPLKSGSL